MDDDYWGGSKRNYQSACITKIGNGFLVTLSAVNVLWVHIPLAISASMFLSTENLLKCFQLIKMDNLPVITHVPVGDVSVKYTLKDAAFISETTKLYRILFNIRLRRF